MGKPRAPEAAIRDLKAHTGFWLRFVSNHVSHAFARKLLDSGVTVAEWVVLREMVERSDLTPSAVADLTGLTRGAASKLVDRLVSKKLVSRQERDLDRRFQDIALTASARKLIPVISKLADQNDEEFFAPLTKEERLALAATLKKLVRAHGMHKIPIQ